MDATTARLVEFAAGFDIERLPAAAVHAAKARLLDSIGCGLAAYLAPPVRALRRVVPIVDDAWSARIWGSLLATTPDLAALVNGSMVRYLDLNDAYRTLDASHPSDNLPGLMAVCEARALSGRDFVLAAAISYEVQCRFTDTVPFNEAGWDQPIVGCVAAALAAGRLMGLSREELGHAVALAVVPHLPTYQTRSGELAMWKGCAGPNGARHGIFAARLAEEGMTGPFEAFEGVFGVWKQTLGEAASFALPAPGHDGPFGIQQSNIKRYPVRDSCQLPIDTALELRAALAGRRPARLRVETYRSAYAGAVADKELWAPRTRETADHSMPFSIAAALVDGAVTGESFERGRFADPDVLELIGAMTIEVADEFSRATPAVRNCRITARLDDGSDVVAHRRLSQAEIERGTPDEVLEAKFHGLLRPLLPERTRRRIVEGVWALDAAPRLRPLIDLLEL
jgi:2-methylcitrate dehydratase